MKRPRKKPPFSYHSRSLLLVLLLVIFSLIGLFFWFSRRTWPENSVRNIMIVPADIDGFTGRIFLVHVDPVAPQIEVAAFPAELMLEVIGGYGQYPIRSIYPLLKLEHRDLHFVTSAYSFGLNQVVDEMWTTQNSALLQSSSKFTQLAQALVSYQVMSPLSLADRVWFYRLVTGLRPDQLVITEVPDLTAWAKIESKFRLPAQAKDCSISIVNTTGEQGIGARVGGVAEQSGFAVLRVTNTDQVEAKSRILFTDDQACAEVIEHLTNLLPIQPELRRDEKIFGEFRSPIVVFLGQDVSQQIQKK